MKNLSRLLWTFALVLWGLAGVANAQTSSADLVVGVGVFPSTVTINNNTTFTVTVSNNGPLSANNVVVTHTLTSGMTFIGVSGVPVNTSGSLLSFDIGFLAVGGSRSFDITMRGDTLGTRPFTVQVSSDSPDPVSANNAASQVITVAGVLNRNLLVNGDAEAGVGANDEFSAGTTPGWTPIVGGFTAVKYGVAGYPTSTSPGPPNRGVNFFTGGSNQASSAARQVFVVTSEASLIDDGDVNYDLEAYLGGYLNQADGAHVAVIFFNQTGTLLGSDQIGPVTAAQRGNATVLLLRQASGLVPPGTRRIEIQVGMTRAEGQYNDGYVDNIVLALTSATATPQLTLNLPAQVREDVHSDSSGSVARSGPTTSAVDVILTPNISGQLNLPSSVRIPAGAASINFNFRAIDDTAAEPASRNVIVTASASGHLAGSDTIAVVDDDSSGGTLVAWGSNEFGQIGDGTRVHRPTRVLLSMANVTAFAANGSHSLAVMSSGNVRSWGYNGGGQLGDGTTVDRHTSVRVLNISNVRAVAAGWYHSLALRNDGTVWGWGYNKFGQVGDGTTRRRVVPKRVVGLTNVRSITAGVYFSVAVKNDGTVWAWGNNVYGQLGNGRAGTNSLVPVRVPNLTNIVAASAGAGHVLFLRSNGQVFAAGWNAYGQLGDGTTMNRATPVLVSSLSGVSAVSGGYAHSLALGSGGAVTGWGNNSYGQLGNGNIGNSNVRATMQLSGPAQSIAAGSNFSAVTLSSGAVQVTGDNTYGQLGRGSVGNLGSSQRTPEDVIGVGSATGIASAYGHAMTVGELTTLPALTKPSQKQF